MAAFLYHVPGSTSMNAQAVREADLDHLVDAKDSRKSILNADASPDNAEGLLVHDTEADAPDPGSDEVQWVPHPDLDCYVGMDPENPPGPDELERAETHARWNTVLGDGNRWAIPTVLDADDRCPLPKERWIDPETGEIRRRPLEKYDDLRTMADRVLEAFREGHSLDADEEVRIFARALRVNYRIGMAGVCLLNLATDSALFNAFSLLVDAPNREDLVQDDAPDSDQEG